MVARVLDALGVPQAHVVGHSIGNVWALRFAIEHPSRVGRVVLTGGGPVVPETAAPRFIKLLASPLGAIIVRLPIKPARVRSLLRDSGHGRSLDAGRIPDAYLQWATAFFNGTDSMRNERDMVRTLVSRTGWRPGLTLEPAELGAVTQPLLWLYGTADPTGSSEIWSRVAALMADAELRTLDGAGHIPWLDEPRLVAGLVGQFLEA